MIHPVLGREWDLFIKPIYTGAAGINQLLNSRMPHTFQQVGKAGNIAVYISHGIFQAIPYPCLRGQITDLVKLVLLEKLRQSFPVFQIQLDKLEAISILFSFDNFIIWQMVISYNTQFG